MATDARDADRGGAQMVHGADGDAAPHEALSLLTSATRVAEETMAAARVEAERLLGSSRDAARQLENEARLKVEAASSDAAGVQRAAAQDAEQTRRAAREESELMVGTARTEAAQIESAIEKLRAERAATAESVREMATQLLRLADSWDGSSTRPAGDGPPVEAGHSAKNW